MAAISKETAAMAISFPVVSLCSTLKGSVTCFFLCSLVIKRLKTFTLGVNTRFPIVNTL